jgi:hypothetical protein
MKNKKRKKTEEKGGTEKKVIRGKRKEAKKI